MDADISNVTDDSLDYSSLLDLDTETDQTPSSDDMKSGNNDEKETLSSDESKLSKEEIETIIKQNKDQRELIRQMGEELKELKEWKERIIGNPDEEKRKKDELELRKRFEEDSIAVVDELIKKRLAEVESKLEKHDIIEKVKDAMQEIEKEYIVNWDKDYEKIVSYLNNFDPKVKREKPKEILLAACKLAGVIKKREKPLKSFPYIEESGKAGIANLEKGIKEKIRERFKKHIKKSNNNIFGI